MLHKTGMPRWFPWLLFWHPIISLMSLQFIIPTKLLGGVYWFHSVRRPDPAVLPVGTLHSLEWFWVSRRIFIYSHHNTFVFSLRRPFVHGLFVSWGATGWRFVINSRTNIYVTNDCSTVLPLVLGVVTRQKLHINGSVVLGADESPWPCGTPSWYTPLSWMILSKQKNLHLFSSQYICVFSKTSVCPSARPSVPHAVSALYHLQLWMDSFHIRHKWSLPWEGVSCTMTFDLDLYLQGHLALT